jgi:hypothetical protein
LATLPNKDNSWWDEDEDDEAEEEEEEEEEELERAGTALITSNLLVTSCFH